MQQPASPSAQDHHFFSASSSSSRLRFEAVSVSAAFSTESACFWCLAIGSSLFLSPTWPVRPPLPPSPRPPPLHCCCPPLISPPTSSKLSPHDQQRRPPPLLLAENSTGQLPSSSSSASASASPVVASTPPVSARSASFQHLQQRSSRRAVSLFDPASSVTSAASSSSTASARRVARQPSSESLYSTHSAPISRHSSAASFSDLILTQNNSASAIPPLPESSAFFTDPEPDVKPYRPPRLSIMLSGFVSYLSGLRPPRAYTRSVQWAVLTFVALLLLIFAAHRHQQPSLNTAPSYAALNDAIYQAHSQAAFTPLVPKSDKDVPIEVLRARPKPKAALISLVRNQEIEGIEMSMRQLEARFNHKYNYPWVFFNDVPFDDEFKARTQNLTSAECKYILIPDEHWSLPPWIDEGRFISSLEYLGAIGVGKGWMISYRHMCRWNSGFFYKHPALDEYDWYWRVEPDVHFFCDIDYDPFAFMAENGLKYGFNMNILDDARSFPSMWRQTQEFMADYPEMIHPDADLSWILDHRNDGEYNNCQFFSNFEIGSLDFFRSKTYNTYFDYIDRKGGFFYERFGDAPLHTLAIVLFLPKRETHFFRDIGYQHDINRQCPAQLFDKCSCEPTNLDENFYKLVPMESPQRKPDDSCIRLWLGGEWLARDENTGEYIKSGFSY